jgi:hypothetical protein
LSYIIAEKHNNPHSVFQMKEPETSQHRHFCKKVEYYEWMEFPGGSAFLHSKSRLHSEEKKEE